MEEDEELLQDFLVEAGEILEQLGEQLVQLENRPSDKELLNAVFRGFHTIKGGASFLALDGLVEVCHRAENVFNILRNGERKVDAMVMDIILPVLDVLNDQFDAIRSRQDVPSIEPALLQSLDALAVPSRETVSTVPPNLVSKVAEPIVSEKIVQEKNVVENSVESYDIFDSPNIDSAATDDISDEEFERLLDTLDNKKSTKQDNSVIVNNVEPITNSIDDDAITEEEFDALLDSLHVEQKGDGIATTNASTTNRSLAVENETLSDAQAIQNDEITEDEFDQLLDQLQSKGGSGSDAQKLKNNTAVSQPKKIESSPPSIKTAQVDSPPNSIVNPAKAPAVKQKEAAPQAESTVRVDTKRLDDIMNMVGELVLVRNRMATLEVAKNDEEMSKVVANLDVVTADLQSAVMKTRMQPIKKVFGRFPRVVRDLARNLKKEVNLEMQGEDTDLDKNLVEALADPLVHLVRNAVDHGVESPEVREAAGKPRTGTIILTAEQEGDHILLTIQDDGKGMDAKELRIAAVEKGMMDKEAADRLEDKECYSLIFSPGFSTKKEISDVSGRGVGMDVVKTRIVQLNGSVEVDSTLGKGSLIIIKVPLTLAIMPTLMVMLERQIFALPLASVNEIFHLDLTKTNVVDGQMVVMVRDKALPLFYLRRWLIKGGGNEALPSEGHVVVVSLGVKRIGFVVDGLIGQEEVVIKPLGALLHGMRGLAGATITGDGRISLILDIPGLMHTYVQRM